MTVCDMRPKLLVVDDNKQNIELLMELFKDEYKIAAAINPERALKVAAQEPRPDIILLDILMPGMDGYQVCQALKENDQTRDIPVIFVTAVSEVMDETRGFSVGAVDYITKPFHPPMVRARVALHLEMKRKQELLEKFAFLDALTEIPNRRRFDEYLDREWRRALRSSLPLALLLVDIDHFKEYNDTYGHGGGDAALRRVAQALQCTLRRAGDFVARYGGEEFAVILPYTDTAMARDIAHQLMEAVQALRIPHATSPVEPFLTVSIGLSTVQPSESLSPSSLLNAADSALYMAKAQGKNLVVAGA
ncbi:diguanylate cyclase domain-containing protein [Megalodesulfovibrio paquesii]